MKKVIDTEKVPIKMWLSEIEDGALKQAKNLANLPFIHKHVAIMPDSHEGYGMPIGGVIATRSVVIPNAVGVDIGCGMMAVQTSLASIDKETLRMVVAEIKRQIPVGFEHHKVAQDESLLPTGHEETEVVKREYNRARHQIGTLGGGNHFIEIQSGDDGHIWFMIHSGSRNLGKQVADHYNKVARNLNKLWHSSVPPEYDLAFLHIHEPAAKLYLKEMDYCVNFAYANRLKMAVVISGILDDIIPGVTIHDQINIAHNYAKWEYHFGENAIIHRKGATSAREGEVGIIPGSQGSKSYIVKGKGNHDSFMSCSHGAGRKMGRKQAQRSLSLDDEVALMNSQGIIHDIDSIDKLDEAAGAYKDIDMVMDNQKDLVDIIVELRPLAVIKG